MSSSPKSNSCGSNHAAVKLLVALGIFMVTLPFVQEMADGDLIESIVLTVVMFAAVRAVGGRRRTHLIALALLVPPLAGKWINHFHPERISPLVYIVGTIVYFGFVVAHLLRFIVRAPRVDGNVLCAGVSGFLLLGLLWVPAYMLVARVNPAAFTLPAGTVMNGFGAFYFSFITLCTVGYGDVAPVSNFARMLAVLEAVTGLFYMAVLVSRLVSMHSSGHSSDRDVP
ncbi:MAG: ion channel [Luteolibacter sp.]|uniref:ion channel n=1 Tax=Luteolibacter sp. TaxID=1962973 RepID=UPI003264C282